MLRSLSPRLGHILIALPPALVVGLGSGTTSAAGGEDAQPPAGRPICPPGGPPLGLYDGEPRASTILFANFDGAQLTSGTDNAPSGKTQISSCAGNLAAYGSGSKRGAAFQAFQFYEAAF